MRDYEDILRQRGLRLWEKDSPEALAARTQYQSDRSDPSDLSDPYGLRSATAEVAANTLICLINQASYLLGRQLQALERQFVEEGGFTERMYAVRSQARESDSLEKPACPRCGKPMLRRTARTGPRAGQPFWGCSAHPDCTGTRPIQLPASSDNHPRKTP